MKPTNARTGNVRLPDGTVIDQSTRRSYANVILKKEDKEKSGHTRFESVWDRLLRPRGAHYPEKL